MAASELASNARLVSPLSAEKSSRSRPGAKPLLNSRQTSPALATPPMLYGAFVLSTKCIPFFFTVLVLRVWLNLKT